MFRIVKLSLLSMLFLSPTFAARIGGGLNSISSNTTGADGFIHNVNDLQTGATVYVSSGTVDGQFIVTGVSVFKSSATMGYPVYIEAIGSGGFPNSTVLSFEPTDDEFSSSFIRNRGLIAGKELPFEIRNQDNSGTHYNAFVIGTPDGNINWSVKDEGGTYWESVDGYTNFYSSGSPVTVLGQKRANFAILVDSTTDDASKPIFRISTNDDGTLKFEVHHGSITFGSDSDFGDFDITSLSKLEFFDAGIYIDGSVDGVLDVVADTTMNIASTVTTLNVGNTTVTTANFGTGATTSNFGADGAVKIAPAASGDIDCFGDTDVGDSTDGKIFKVHRKAAEGDSYIQFYASQYGDTYIYGSPFNSSKTFVIENGASGPLALNFGAAGDVTLFQNAQSGENPKLRQAGYITNGANEVEVIWQVEDTNDYYLLDRENTNIVGFKINMPTIVMDKLSLTQTDGNEYIDSLNDGYLDLGATISIRFNSDEAQLVKAMDEGDVELMLINSAGSGSTDETVTLSFKHIDSTTEGGKIVSGRVDNYSAGAAEESFMRIYTTDGGTDELAVEINELQDWDFQANKLTTTGQGTFGILIVDTLQLDANRITDTTGTIDFVTDILQTGNAIYLTQTDGAEKIDSSADGQVDIAAGTEVEIVAPTIDIDASSEVNISNDLTVAGRLKGTPQIMIWSYNVNNRTTDLFMRWGGIANAGTTNGLRFPRAGSITALVASVNVVSYSAGAEIHFELRKNNGEVFATEWVVDATGVKSWMTTQARDTDTFVAETDFLSLYMNLVGTISVSQPQGSLEIIIDG